MREKIDKWKNKLKYKDGLYLVTAVYIYAIIFLFIISYISQDFTWLSFAGFIGKAAGLNFVTILVISYLTEREDVFLDEYSIRKILDKKRD